MGNRFGLLFLALSLFFVESVSGVENCTPEKNKILGKEDLLRDSTSALKVAESILVVVYGDKVLSERPFKVHRHGDRWNVEGTMHCKNCFGGVAFISIRSADAKVLDVSHGN